MNKLSGNKEKNDHDGVKFKIESPTIEIKKNGQPSEIHSMNTTAKRREYIIMHKIYEYLHVQSK